MVSYGTKRDKVKEVARNSKVVLTGELEMPYCWKITQKVSFLALQENLLQLVMIVLSAKSQDGKWDIFANFQTLWNGRVRELKATKKSLQKMSLKTTTLHDYLPNLVAAAKTQFFARFHSTLLLISISPTKLCKVVVHFRNFPWNEANAKTWGSSCNTRHSEQKEREREAVSDSYV